MGKRLEGKKLQDIAFARYQDDRLLVAQEVNRSALFGMKRFLVFCTASEHLFLVCTRRLQGFGWVGGAIGGKKFFKRTTPCRRG